MTYSQEWYISRDIDIAVKEFTTSIRTNPEALSQILTPSPEVQTLLNYLLVANADVIAHDIALGITKHGVWNGDTDKWYYEYERKLQILLDSARGKVNCMHPQKYDQLAVWQYFHPYAKRHPLI